jgi:hypothetical protein
MRVAILLAVLALALAGPPGAAQEQPPDGAVPDRIPAAPAVTVVPIRSERFLRDALADTKMHDREAEATLSRATEERARARARIEVKKREIATIDARRKLADREKNESAKAGLAIEKRAAEAERKLAERLDAVYESEIELARKSRDLARAEERALELELELAERRTERNRLAQTEAASVSRLESVIVALERRVLEARRAQASASKDVATRREKIADRRLQLFEANLEATRRGGR